MNGFNLGALKNIRLLISMTAAIFLLWNLAWAEEPITATGSVAGSTEASAEAPSAVDNITLVQIKGSINPGSADYIKTALQQSEKLKSQAMIIALDTPGGLLSSTREIVQTFSQSSIPVVVFVSPGGASATSAGAVLSLSAHLSAMAPGTNIGAAHPVGLGGEDVKSSMGTKVTNDTAAMVRAQASLRGHNVEIAEKIVTESLSLSAEEAKAKGIVHFVAADLEALLRQLDQKKVFVEGNKTEVVLTTKELKATDLVPIKMSWSQNFLHVIADPNISTTLLALAGMAFYVEIASGFSLVVPGVLGLVLAVLGSISLSMLPINLGGLLLLGLGLVFIVAEIFVTSFGILFIGGLAAITLGTLFLIDPNASSIRVSYLVLGPMLAAFAVVGGLIAWMLKKEGGPRRPGHDELHGQSGKVQVVNSDGRSGQLFVAGEIWNFTADEEVRVADLVEVISRRNLQLKVKRRT